jgi:ubiquitin C-terminal hydrolase
MYYSANIGHDYFLSIPFYLQNAVSKSALQYRGNSQHDAQEFLLWLLDRVHEDLNAVNPESGPAIRVSPGIG